MVMSIYEKYNDIGIDPMKATEIMELLGVNPNDLIDPNRFKRFQDTAKYLSQFENYPYMIKKLTVGKNIDKLNHMWEWSTLAKQRQELSAKFAQASTEEQELSSDKSIDGLDRYAIVKTKVDRAMTSLKAIEAEMNIYE